MTFVILLEHSRKISSLLRPNINITLGVVGVTAAANDNMTFRLDAKNISLTYPKCDLTRERVLGFLKLLGGDNYRGGAACIEAHSDGTPHVHAYLRLSNKRCFRDPRAFDIDGYHANIQPCRNPKHWLNYLRKEDKSPGLDGDLDDLLSSAKPKERLTDVIARRIESGDNSAAIFESFPGFYMMNKRKIEELQEFMVRKRQKLDKLDWEEACSKLAEAQVEAQQVSDWLMENIKKPRKLRTPQLWIQGPPGSGKTSLIEELAKYLSVFYVPMDDGKYLDGFSDDYDLIVFDEMKSQFKLTFLNQFIVGSPMMVNVKGAMVLKQKNTPVMFLSNYGVMSAYKKMTPALEAFLDRLLMVNITSLHSLNQILESASTAQKTGSTVPATATTPPSPSN